MENFFLAPIHCEKFGRGKGIHCQVDEEYVRRRNALIPEAMEFADREVEKLGDKSPWDKNRFWNNFFHNRMNYLWKKNRQRV